MAAQQELVRRVLDYAKKLWEAMGRSLPKLDTSTRAVLNTRLLDADIRWGLALVLAIWRLGKMEPDGAKVTEILISHGGNLLLSQLNRLGGLLPDSFDRFLDSARASTESYQLAGSAVYFSSTVGALEASQLAVLYAWLRGAPFRECGAALIQDFPSPDSQRPPVKADLGAVAPKTIARADRFDRADLGQRRASGRATAPLSATTPVLDGEDIARVHLASLGWDDATIATTLAGRRKG